MAGWHNREALMAWDRIETNWKEFRNKIERRWEKLTEDDLTAIKGGSDELARRIEKRYGIERAAAHRQIDDWLREPGVLDDWNDKRAILDM